MNFEIIFYIIGYALKVEGVLMLLPALVGFLYKEIQAGVIYAGFSAVAYTAGALITRRKPRNQTFYAREGLVAVPLTWLVLSFVGCMPFIFTGDIPNLVDAMFEMVSGFTTTGSTILTDVEAVTMATNFWRCFSHWIGGMGILVFVLTVLPLTGGSTMQIMKAESPGPEVSKIVPKIKDTSKILYVIYTAMTLAEIVLLLLCKVPLYDAATISFGTAGTGGFGIKGDSIAGYAPVVQYIVAIFMILFGVNFNAYFLLTRKQVKRALSMEEPRWYLGIIGASVAFIVLNVRSFFPTLEETFRHSLFSVASIITTTGFATCDFDLWPAFSKNILLLLMFIGACAGSTGGGMKVSRIVLSLKSIKEELASSIHPRAVRNVHMDSKAVDRETLRHMYNYILAYAAVFIVSLFIVSADKYGFISNFSGVAATINNIGPGFEAVGPVMNFAGYSPLSKIVFTFDMLAGRLEIIPVLVLLYPDTWKARKKR